MTAPLAPLSTMLAAKLTKLWHLTMVVGCHQQPTIVASFFDNVKRLQMLHQQLSLTLTSWPSFFDNGSHLLWQWQPHNWQYSNNHPPCSFWNDFFKPHIKAYNTPSNGNIYFRVRQSLSEYFNVITSSPLFQESTHPGVASALCSTLGTTPYFSVSLSLLV